MFWRKRQKAEDALAHCRRDSRRPDRAGRRKVAAGGGGIAASAALAFMSSQQHQRNGDVILDDFETVAKRLEWTRTRRGLRQS